MAGVRDPLREAGGAALALFGLGGSDEDVAGPEHHRDALFLVVQVGVLAAAAAVLGVLKALLAEAPTVPAWVVSAFLLAIPVTMAAVGKPPRRLSGLAAGLLVGLATGLLTVALLSLAGLSGTDFWPGFAAIVTGFLTGSAVFGWVTTGAATSR